MASDSDNLRRSKRNKYHLDVTTLSLANHEKRRNSSVAPIEEFCEATPSPGPSVPEIQNLSVENGLDMTPGTEENKRSRRPTAKNSSFVYADESEDEEEKVTSGMYGNFKCDKCPSRFESKPGLANHIRLHGRSDKRKFGCDQCDFSCGSAKAIRNHKRIHNRPLFKEESPPVTHSDTRSDTSESHTPPLLTPVRTEAPQVHETPPSTGDPPKLAAVSPNPVTKAEAPSRKRNRCPECPFTARNRIRYERHIMMHSKSTGFQCHSCSLTTQSSGFLKRHIVEIHKETDFPWPPKFIGETQTASVKVPEEKDRKKNDRAKVFLRSVKIDGEKMLCPVEGCTFSGYMRNQIALHKMRMHSEKTKKTLHSCCTCGLKLRTPGALRVHRLTRHPRRKICERAKKTLFKEANPMLRLRKIITEMRRNAAVSAANIATSNSEQPTPAPSPPQLQTSQSAPSLIESADTVSSSLLGSNLPKCLIGMTYSIKELATELEKTQEQELKCPECPYTTNVSASLERHVAKHNLLAEFQCPLCSFCCRGEDLLKQHVRLHMAIIWKQRKEAEKLVGDLPQIISPTVTPAKNNENSSPSKLIEEKKKTTSVSAKKRKATNIFINKDGIRMRRCLECPYATKHACDLASHYNMHVNEPQKFKCTQCTYSTKRAVSLKTHYQCHRETNKEQENVRPLQLKVNGVNVGLRTGHGNNRIYSCRQCPFVARGIVLLNQHYRNHIYTKRTSYKCSKCPFYSSQCEVVEEHILIHPEMDVQTVRLVPLTRGKRNLDETVGRTSPPVRAKRTPRGSNCPSPAPPVLVKEEPMDYETSSNSNSNSNSSKLSQQKMEMDEDSSLDRKPTPDIGKPALGHSFDQPLSIQVQQFLQPEPALLRLLRKEGQAEKLGQCPDCPYIDADDLLMRLHRECHQGPPKLQKCDLCSFSCMAPEALHKHMSLHLPALSPNSERLERKKAVHRRRSAANEVIPQGVPHFACSKCAFKSMTKDAFQEHMIFHAQELQRRLMTTIKRANIQAEELAKSAKAAKSSRRAPKKSDKFHSCPSCSFRCETSNSYVRHSEMHTLNGLHKCAMCTYSADTYSITLFHQMNHHSDHTLAGLTKSAILAPEAITMEVERTEEKIQKLADNVFRCNRCDNFTCYELLQLRRHFEEYHYETPDDKAAVESLAMGMLPTNSIITTA